jgi:integrase
MNNPVAYLTFAGGNSPPLCGKITAAVPNRKRGKSMSRRFGQSGSVVKKSKMWHGRYYVDVAGQEQRKRMSVPLGPVSDMTKSEARRKLMDMLHELGVNTAAHLERASCGATTFGQQAEWFMENKIPLMKESSQQAMTYHLRKYLLPYFGHLAVAGIDGKRVQEFITELTHIPLAPSTIMTIYGTLRVVVGKKTWRDWDVSMPRQERKEQRYFTPEEMEQIVMACSGQWRVIFGLLAGTGLRAGEAFGLHVEDVDLNNNTVTVRRGSWHGKETTPKTENAYRTVNIDDGLADLLRQHIAGRQSGHLFVTAVGTIYKTDVVRKKLHSVLRRLGLPMGGLHSFRHGRVSLLRARGVPSDLVLQWIGHSNLNTTSRYTHFGQQYKKDVANKLAVGPMDPSLFAPTVSKHLVN